MHLEQIDILRKKDAVFWYVILIFFSYFFLFRIKDSLLTVRFVLQRFLWEAWQDLTLIILIVAAIASLGLGIKTEVCLVLI
jgi:hypothetical protein